MNKIIGQENLIKNIINILKIFKASDTTIRPHFILTGSSGSGKSFTVKTLCEENKLEFLEINAAALTKEGTSGNSLTKALSPLLQMGSKPCIVFVDEFDKLFISGNSNSDLAHESTNGVQNEFLKVLESDTSSVFGDFGKYVQAKTDNCLFIFAGAFNGQKDISIDDLRDFGIKTEFLGRVGLCYNTSELSLSDLLEILDSSDLLSSYLLIFQNVKRKDVIDSIKHDIEDNFETNTLGARQINTLIHQYFVTGGNKNKENSKPVFKKHLELT